MYTYMYTCIRKGGTLQTPRCGDPELSQDGYAFKDDRGNKTKNQYSKGTGDLRIKLKPKVNTGMTGQGGSGGLN